MNLEQSLAPIRLFHPASENFPPQLKASLAKGELEELPWVSVSDQALVC